MQTRRPKSVARPSVTPSQRQRFEEAARALECDDDKDRFEKRLGKIAKVNPRKASE